MALLGYSALHTSTPWAVDVTLDDMLNLRAGNGLAHPMRPSFHRDDVPDDIVIADITRSPGAFGSTSPWGTAYAPGGPALTMTRRPRDPGVVAADAIRIRVPVLVSCGDVEVVSDPWAERAAYRGSSHVTVAVVGQMAHMHNFASTRRQLWERLDASALTVARTSRAPSTARRAHP